MESAHFRDQSIDSPIVVTSLEATRYRHFEAVLLIGATAGNLPGKAARSGLFNQSVRQAMGLPTFAEDIERISQDLFGLLARSPASYVSWQGAGGDEVQEPAPWVAALHLEARRRGLSLQGPREMATTPQAAASPVPRPAPVLSTNQVPARVTASQYQSLIDCPYQYFARAVLRLREADEVQEEMEKRDFGEFVHAILHRFHLRVPLVSALASDNARAVLLDETAAVFAAALEQNFMARAWRLQWESAIDAYIFWQRAREGEGWRWQAGELGSAFELELDGGQLLRIEGRIDRVDMRRSNDGEESAVIDYKARAQSLLNAKLNKPGEDVQLPVYIALAEANWPERGVGEAAYLGITRGEVKAALYPDAASAGQRHVVRLTHLFEKIHQGAPLPAQGNELACRYCEARGLCRRDHWPVEVADG
jgi:ATP-dependent helicase/nuclease subunit B